MKVLGGKSTCRTLEDSEDRKMVVSLGQWYVGIVGNIKVVLLETLN